MNSLCRPVASSCLHNETHRVKSWLLNVKVSPGAPSVNVLTFRSVADDGDQQEGQQRHCRCSCHCVGPPAGNWNTESVKVIQLIGSQSMIGDWTSSCLGSPHEPNTPKSHHGEEPLISPHVAVGTFFDHSALGRLVASHY